MTLKKRSVRSQRSGRDEPEIRERFFLEIRQTDVVKKQDTIEINKLVIHSNVNEIFESFCAVTEKNKQLV
jgi:hypothetical protein